MPSLLTCALLAEDVYHDRPTIVDGFSPVRVPDHEVYCAGCEFSGGAYAGPQGIGVIAFRGSRELEDWRGANLEILRRRLPTGQFGHALAYFASAYRALERNGSRRYVVVGHSLGGGLAAVVAGIVTWVPVRGVTFNAPGLAGFAANYPAEGPVLSRANEDNVFNFRSEIDVVSRWGRHIGHVYDVAGSRRHGIRPLINQLGLVDFGRWEI
jgi:pimeloyl-ACP methyl ester carboxylesterase